MTKTFRIPVSNGLLEHCDIIGISVWLFLWCIDKTTREKRDDSGHLYGIVLGGMPCRDEDIADQLKVSVNTIRNWRTKLSKLGYIRTKRAPNGHIIHVAKSKKWVSSDSQNVVSPSGKKESQKAGSQVNSDSQEVVNHSGQSEPQTLPSDSQLPRPDSQDLRPDCTKVVNAIRQCSDVSETQQKTKSLSPQPKTPGQEPESTKALVDYVIQVAYDSSDGKVTISKKQKLEIAEVVGRARPSRNDIQIVVDEIVSGMNDFTMVRGGDNLATTLGPALMRQANKEAESKRQADNVARAIEAGKAQAEATTQALLNKSEEDEYAEYQ